MTCGCGHEEMGTNCSHEGSDFGTVPVSSSSGSETDERRESFMEAILDQCVPEEVLEIGARQVKDIVAIAKWLAPVAVDWADSELVAAVTAERERADEAEDIADDLRGYLARCADALAARKVELDAMRAENARLTAVLADRTEQLDRLTARSADFIRNGPDAAESELAGLRERIEALEPLFVQPQQPDDNGDRDFALGYNEALREVLRALGSATKTGEGT